MKVIKIDLSKFKNREEKLNAIDCEIKKLNESNMKVVRGQYNGITDTVTIAFTSI